jgi:predicted phage terminase large subunit-like protein
MILDDICDQERVNTQQSRDNTWGWFARQLSVLDPQSQLVCLGTRWHWDDVYTRIERTFVKYRDNPRVGWYVERRACIEKGEVIFPTRFTKEEFDQIRRAQGDYIFSCFYYNDPVGEGVNPFDTNRFSWIEYDKKADDAWTYILVDPASTRESYSSYTGIIIADAIPNRQLVVREAILEKMHPDTLIDRIFLLVDREKPFRVIVEDEAYQKSIYYWLRREMTRMGRHFQIQMIKNPRNLSQEARLISMQPYLHNGAICFKKNFPGLQDLMEEFETFPKGPHKDLICALYFGTQAVFPPKRREKANEVPKLLTRQKKINEMVRRPIRRGRMPRLRIGGLR